MSDWEVFQKDVLDVLTQYQGYLDFYERVGSLSDDSRPDCFARITRKNKKEVWVIDAKNKGQINQKDLERMNKYLEMLKTNPIDTGLEIKELSDYKFRGIFVTSQKTPELEKHETIPFKAFHQFLQKELVYTDTDRVVRDLSKMIERKQLPQEQARLLFQSVKPFENKINQAVDTLKQIETKYVGLKLKEPPLTSFEYNIPVDAVITHQQRDEVFLFDIPYSWESVKKVDEKVEEVKNRIDKLDKKVYYTAINTFQPYKSDYILQPRQVEQEIKETSGIISPDEIAELFTPKLKTEKNYTDNAIIITDKHGFNFKLAVKTQNDIKHQIEAIVPEKTVSKIKDAQLNSQKKLGELKGNRFQLEIEVTPELEIRHSGNTENLQLFKDTVKTVYNTSINPVLSKKVSIN